MDEAIDICREAVHRDPTILWSRKLLTKLEMLKADPNSVKEDEPPPKSPTPSNAPATEGKGCMMVLFLLLALAASAFAWVGRS